MRDYYKPAPASDGMGTVVVDVCAMEKRIKELEALLRDALDCVSAADLALNPHLLECSRALEGKEVK